MTANLDFHCTQCGKCCHDLKLPLTVAEAVRWLGAGHTVQLLCEAVPWPTEPPASDLQAQHKRRRSFAAISGSLPTRVVVILAASFAGACPNLLPDMRCGIYTRRPLVCRIYPAEISPFIALAPASKACPPDAWSTRGTPLVHGGRIVDVEMHALIQRSREADEAETGIKARLCALLDCDTAAMANEGFVVHSPDPESLLDRLTEALALPDERVVRGQWRFVSNQRATVDALIEVGASISFARSGDTSGPQYIGFRTAST